jgi:hypothetical protein
MKSENNVLLHEYLQNSRIKAGFTLNEASEKLGHTTTQFLSDWETGIASPPLYAISILIKIYKLDLEEVFHIVLKQLPPKNN